jgi:hypothetical protein
MGMKGGNLRGRGVQEVNIKCSNYVKEEEE